MRVKSAGLLMLLSLLFGTFPLALAGQAGPQRTMIVMGGGTIDVRLPDSSMALSRAELLHWVRAAATAVTHYYGHYPVAHVTLRIRSFEGSGVRHGVTFPWHGGTIMIHVGTETTVAELKRDWMLTHEMVHLAFPSMADNHHWIEEGIATYVEPIARAEVDEYPVSSVWRQFVRDMPQGEPAPGDMGLDRTSTWGRTYWGGAMFCLLADVQIREQTHNRMGLQDALRAIVNHGGVISQDWTIEKALATGDRATGTHVLENLYGKMRDKPVNVDLDQLWKQLGVETNGHSVSFQNSVPDAATRMAITPPRG